MWWYIVICLALALAGVAGLQFFYLAYLEKINSHHRRRLAELERRCERLAYRLHEAEQKLNDYQDIITTEPAEEEIWAEIIDDDGIR
jgi:16S rRNA C1402 (ribose-2'-O) methylase RsmI